MLYFRNMSSFTLSLLFFHIYFFVYRFWHICSKPVRDNSGAIQKSSRLSSEREERASNQKKSLSPSSNHASQYTNYYYSQPLDLRSGYITCPYSRIQRSRACVKMWSQPFVRPSFQNGPKVLSQQQPVNPRLFQLSE